MLFNLITCVLPDTALVRIVLIECTPVNYGPCSQDFETSAVNDGKYLVAISRGNQITLIRSPAWFACLRRICVDVDTTCQGLVANRIPVDVCTCEWFFVLTLMV